MFKQILLLSLLSYVGIPYVALYAQDYHETRPKAWEADTLNSAAIALYGKQKFSTIKKSLNVELIIKKGLIQDSQNIAVRIRTNIPAKSIAIFQDANPRALVAVFHQNHFDKTDLTVNIRMEKKGTVFAVIESMSGVLYYKREFVEILCLPCMAK